MARYTKSKHKLARRYGVNILDKTSASLQRRLNVLPGVHGAKRKRQLSEYGLQLKEKQKAKSTYGIMEKQFKNIMQDLQKQKGDTGELLVSRLETRLDNIVYRLGFAKTRYQARQFVSHNHVMVNGKKINIPSYRVKKDDVISLTEKMHQKLIELPIEEINVLSFLERDRSSGKLSRLPKREDVQVPFDTQLIIEYYSR
ncbi:30S ribosomal protein S4 [Candidatus Levyibacteriota bacterium]|nr:30S ribosomal protein S4 [Candidatus Levybacteria bacterium]GDX62378.1 30S ribosomal protein S4 [Candidatus Levybacteria bacterium]